MTFACEHLPFARAVDAVLVEAGVHVDRSEWELHAGGSAHIVVNAGHVMSVRIAKNPTSGENVRRRTRALARLPEFDFAVPRPLTPVIQDGRFTAVGMTWIPAPPGSRVPWSPVNCTVCSRSSETPIRGGPSRGWTGPVSTGVGTVAATCCWTRCFHVCCPATVLVR